MVAQSRLMALDTLYFAGDPAQRNVIIENPQMDDTFDADRPLGMQRTFLLQNNFR
jgi:hypothetical protein